MSGLGKCPEGLQGICGVHVVKEFSVSKVKEMQTTISDNVRYTGSEGGGHSKG
jgi:hypothetical protein